MQLMQLFKVFLATDNVNCTTELRKRVCWDNHTYITLPLLMPKYVPFSVQENPLRKFVFLLTPVVKVKL